ncbi:MAG: hypothetical protein O3B13_15775 [Planctomycetota bacterium]|nr:hypothetical protein [Planctomycetota bacterium]
MRRLLLGLAPLCMLLTMSGCGNDKTPDPTVTGEQLSDSTDGGGTAVATDDSTSPKDQGSKPHTHPPTQPEVPVRENLNGNWLLTFPQIVPPQQQGQEMQVGERAIFLLKIAGADGDVATATAVVGKQGLEEATITKTTVSDGAVSFEVSSPDGEKIFEYSGVLKMGIVIGTTVFADGSIVTARLLATQERTFARIPAMIPLPEAHVFLQLASSPVPDEDTRAFVEMIPVSPLGRIAYLRLVNVSAGNKASVEELERIINEYTTTMQEWGDTAALYSEFEAFNAVTMAGYDIGWCLAKADELEEKLNGNEVFKGVVEQIAGLRRRVQYRQTTELLQSADEADRAKARELAEGFLKEAPYEPTISVLLADDARNSKRVDEAIKRYAELAAFPMQERILQQMWANEAIQKVLPTERLAKLWKDKNGGTDGLDEYIETIYRTELLSFAASTIEATPEDSSKQTVLCELFTGTRCPPCVAADVALEGVEKTYPQSQVITLRYHVHVPGHDPLTNDDCEARFYNYYKANGTPTLLANGKSLDGVAGLMMNAPGVYKGLQTVIGELREKKAEVAIDLKASRQQDSIQVSASVTGLTPESTNVRLNLALAESDIHFGAFNGIRHHDMVVRHLIGGDRGISPKDGELNFQGTVNVEELRDRLHSYLTKFEQNQGVEFTSMPLELKNLSIVAFVQDTETHTVLQAVVVPVSGAVIAE